jgi:hypothetical protein
MPLLAIPYRSCAAESPGARQTINFTFWNGPAEKIVQRGNTSVGLLGASYTLRKDFHPYATIPILSLVIQA